MRIHADFAVAAAVHFDAAKFIESPAAGVSRFMLDRIGEEKARATTIVRYQPNSRFPEHEHIGGEEFMVLAGTFKDQFGEFPAGTYVRNPIGSKHAPWVDEDGCTIMVKLLQMAETGEGTSPLHVDFGKTKSEQAQQTPFGSKSRLYSNEKTGEVVEALWAHADASIPADELALKGEEIFVVDGSIALDGEAFERWGWCRFPAAPPSDKRLSLKAGPVGATLYRKTGHLTEEAMRMERIKIT
eukprot:3911880-Pleurochrysis_carterae.AAC.3